MTPFMQNPPHTHTHWLIWWRACLNLCRPLFWILCLWHLHRNLWHSSNHAIQLVSTQLPHCNKKKRKHFYYLRLSACQSLTTLKTFHNVLPPRIKERRVSAALLLSLLPETCHESFVYLSLVKCPCVKRCALHSLTPSSRLKWMALTRPTKREIIKTKIAEKKT